jgi:predicted DNA-binding transcriptional regulator AlpA
MMIPIKRTGFAHGPQSRELTISDGMMESSAGSDRAPEVASDDDGDGDGDPDSDRRRRPKTFSPSFAPSLLAFAALSHYVSFGRSRIYQLINAGEFPQPIKVGKSSRWKKADVDQWIASQSNRIGG